MRHLSTAATATTALLVLLACPNASSFQSHLKPAASTSPLFRERSKDASVAERPVARLRLPPSDAMLRMSSLSSSSSESVDAPPPSSDNDASVDNEDAASPPESSAELGAWIPLASASALTGLGPQRIRVCGLDFAVWHKPLPAKSKKGTAATEWSAVTDACPHRLAPLSQGRVDPATGCLECPYHGWQFEADGSLTAIPQLDAGKDIKAVGARGNAQSFPVRASGDLLFVFLPTSVTGESFPKSVAPEESYPYLQNDIDGEKAYYVRELPYSADFLIENFMDPAHIPYAHHKLQSTRDEDGMPIDMTVLVNNFTHVEVTFKDKSGGKKRDGVASFQRPAFYHFRTRREDGEMKPNLCIFVAPIEAGKTRVMFTAILPKFIPTWLSHAGSNRFLNTDTWLHDAERRLRMVGGANKAGDAGVGGLDYVYASQSDLGVSAFRKWWSTYGFSDAPRNTFGPASAEDLDPRALSRYEQIDPWVHHSKHCSECRSALGKMKKLERLSLVGAAASVIFLRNRPIFAIAGALLGLWGNNFTKKCATVIEGNPYQSGVADRSAAAEAD